MKTRLKAEWAWATASRQPVIHEPLCATGEFVTVTFSGRGSGVVETRGFGASAARLAGYVRKPRNQRARSSSAGRALCGTQGFHWAKRGRSRSN